MYFPAEQIQLCQYKVGETIFRQDETDYILYKILKGKVGLYLDYGKRQEMKLKELHKDAHFGEMSVLEKRPHSATAIALEETTLMLYPEKMFEIFILQNPHFALDIMRNLSERLRDSTKELEKNHHMLLKAADEASKPSKEIMEYIKIHTVYEDGVPKFVLKV